jgi:hypothetical protein
MRRLTATLVLALVLAPLAAAAAKGPVFGLRAVGNPKLGYFVYPMRAGSVQHGGVIISNSGTATGTVKLFTADATTGRTTGTVYLTDRKPKRVGAWISLSASSLTLKPGQHRTVNFTVRVPTNAKPGQWVGGVVAETSRQVKGPKSKQKANVQINIRDLTIVAVQVNTPAHPVHAFTIGRVKAGGQHGFQELVTHIANAGNVLVKPKGTVTVFDSRGGKLQTLTFKMDTFLPQTAIDYPLLLKKALPPGDYKTSIRLLVPEASGAAAQVVTAHPAFSISKQDVQQVFTSAAPQKPPASAVGATGASDQPWPLIAAAAIGILLLLLLLWVMLRRSKQKTALRPPTVVLRSTSATGAEGPPPAQGVAADEAQPGAVPFPAPVSERTAPPPPPAPPTRAAAPVAEAAPTAPTSQCDHYWEVAYDRGQLGEDGVWRFPHRCRNCGLELLAADVADATAQAHARS